MQEIGPRFTLKLKSLRKGLPAVMEFGEAPKKMVFDVGDKEAVKEDDVEERVGVEEEVKKKKVIKPPSQDEYLWIWKVGFSAFLKIYGQTLIYFDIAGVGDHAEDFLSVVLITFFCAYRYTYTQPRKIHKKKKRCRNQY